MQKVTIVKLSHPSMEKHKELKALKDKPDLLNYHSDVYDLLVDDSGSYFLQVVHNRHGKSVEKVYPVLFEAGILII